MSRQRDINWLYNLFGHHLSTYGVSSNDLKAAYDEKDSIFDFAWAFFNKILAETANSLSREEISFMDFYDKNHRTYGQMSVLLIEQKRNPISVQILALENYINFAQLRFPNLLGLQVFSVNCCSGCDAYYQKILSIEEAHEYAKDTTTRCANKYGLGCRTTLIPSIPPDRYSSIKIVTTISKEY